MGHLDKEGKGGGDIAAGGGSVEHAGVGLCRTAGVSGLSACLSSAIACAVCPTLQKQNDDDALDDEEEEEDQGILDDLEIGGEAWFDDVKGGGKDDDGDLDGWIDMDKILVRFRDVESGGLVGGWGRREEGMVGQEGGSHSGRGASPEVCSAHFRYTDWVPYTSRVVNTCAMCC